MSESSFFEKILAYMGENKRIAALEAEIIDMVVGAKSMEFNDTGQGENTVPKSPEEQVHEETIDQRLDDIYDDEPLGFEKDPGSSSAKMLAHDPLEEINLEDGTTKRVTYITTPKDEYLMPVAEMLVDSVAGYEYLSMLDGYSGYNEIFIAEEDVYLDDIVIKSISDEDHLIHLSQSFERMRKHGLKMNPLKCAFCVQARDFMGFVVHENGIEINQNKTKAIMDTKAPSTKKELVSLLGKINFLRRFISNLSGRIQAFSPLLRPKHGNFEWTSEHQGAFEKIKQYMMNPPILSPPSGKKPMRLYISASDTSMGSMLAQEDENGIERAIYYLSKVLNDAENRYTSIEKLCLCLHFSCTKLKYYIKPIYLYVSSHFDVIKYMLSKPIMHSRIGNWALALTEYSLAFMPLKAMKGQVVSDFIVDHAVVETPQLLVELKPWRLFFNGSTHKEGSGVGILLILTDGIPTKLKYRIEGPSCSNNEAEHEALIAELEALLELGATRVEIKGDSELISKEKLEELVKVRGKARETKLSPSDLERNCLGYANEEEFEVLAIDTLTNTDWRSSIIEYLKDSSLNTDRKTKYRALSYVLMGNELFKKTLEGILLKCLGENEGYLALYNVHSGKCGAHQAGHKMKWLLFRYGMYWPTMLNDCIEFAKGCQECQIHAGIQHAPTSEIHTIIKPWPFRGWALDLIGEI
ncbi:uncharacterized protein LOC131659384 [Vicia villosa]|uniref:uncharacterized protein LOC131659384 n=1 Tax=Vicia villosa TaxID=3911 RepID=UPI00273B60E2|nr:uncharacterized protein LOC131659384 [Vicia villosa]